MYGVKMIVPKTKDLYIASAVASQIVQKHQKKIK